MIHLFVQGLVIGIVLLPSVLYGNSDSSLHPLLRLLDKEGVPVLVSKKPISTKRSCGSCHDYDVISDSLHVQQGRNEHPSQVKSQTQLPGTSWSPGMYGKYCSMPNRQVPPVDVASVDEFDLGAPEWVRACGSCHPGGGPAETDDLGRRMDTVDPATTQPLDIYYHYYDKIQGKLRTWDWRESGVAEVNCFMCHTPNYNEALRTEYIRDGYFGDAFSASLVDTGVVEEDEDSGELKYIPEAFDANGFVKKNLLALTKPGVQQCGQCHGFAAVGEQANQIRPFYEDGDIRRGTKKMGRIWSSGLIKDSDASIPGKEKLDFPWDAHAAKGLICVDCHFSRNNPAKMVRPLEKAHLRYSPKTTSWPDYLRHPDHSFAKGSTYPETVRSDLSFSMRTCTNCHDPMAGHHSWLPYAEHHFKRLSCETCHVPYKHYWAYKQLDISAQDRPAAKARGIIGSYKNPESKIVGFQPAYLPRIDRDGLRKIITVNPITSLLWIDAGRNNRPAFERELTRAFYVRDENFRLSYRPEMVEGFDKNGDGELQKEELRMDSPKKVRLATSFLREAGLKEPHLELEMISFGLNHNISKKTALRDCLECHRSNSRLFVDYEIFDYVPEKANVDCLVCGSYERAPVTNKDGKVFYRSADLLSDFYVIGASRSLWVELLGWLSIFGALFGTIGHGFLRWYMPRRKKQEEEEESDA